ncbi:hypothetical protein Esti_001296 [Eimeria stiedai]
MLSSPFPGLASEEPSAAQGSLLESLPVAVEAPADAWGAREFGKEGLTDGFLPFSSTLTATYTPETLGASTSLISQADSMEAVNEWAGERASVDGKLVASPLSPNRPVRSSRIALSPASLTAYLAILLGLGVLAFLTKARQIPRARETSAVGTPSSEEVLAERFSALKDMLPVADHLAKVVCTPEIGKQAAQARLYLERAQSAQETDNIKTLEFLERAEAALNNLREAALADADAIIKDEHAPTMDGVVLFLNQVENAQLTNSQAKTLSPFLYVLKSIHAQFEKLTEAMEEVRSHFEEETRFEAGLDQSALGSLVEDMNFLLKLKQHRKSLVEHAREQQSGAAGALGLVLTQGFTRDLRQLHGSLDVAEVYYDLASTVAADAAARGQIDEGLEKCLLALQLQLSQSKRQLAQLLEDTVMIPLQKKPATILSRSTAVGAAHKELSISLAASFDQTVRHLRIPAELELFALERVKEMVKTSLERISQEETVLLDLLNSALNEMEKVSGGTHADIQNVRVFENAAFERMVRVSVGALLAFKAKAETRVFSVSSLLDSLQPGISAQKAADIMEEAAKLGAASSADLAGTAGVHAQEAEKEWRREVGMLRERGAGA